MDSLTKGATDAAVSADGQVIVIREYNKAYLWPSDSSNRGKSVVDILRSRVKGCQFQPSVGEYNRQGESVALSPDGKSYFTHGKYSRSNIYRFDIH